ENTGTHDLDDAIDSLNNLSNKLNTFSSLLEPLKEVVKDGDTNQIKKALQPIKDLSDNITETINKIDAEATSQTINKILTQLIATIKNAQGLLTQAQAIDFESLLSSTSKTVSNAITLLEK